jgi:hypothetical protein
MNGPDTRINGTTWRRRSYGRHIDMGDSQTLADYVKERSEARSERERRQAIRAPAEPGYAGNFNQSNGYAGRVKDRIRSSIEMSISLFKTLFEKQKEDNMQRKAEESPAGQRVKELQDEITARVEEIESLTREVVKLAERRK